MNSEDIAHVWDEHLKCEFETHDVEGAMNTMVKEPYVHDVPVPTGGIGHDGVYNFYKNHFVGKTPTDTNIVSGLLVYLIFPGYAEKSYLKKLLL